MKISREYKHLIIKEYDFWTLVLHEKQDPYLGRCYAWWKDRKPHEGENLPLNALPPEAILELYVKIFGEVMETCDWGFGYRTKPYGKRFLLNTSYMANMEEHNHHMHAHFIPRSFVPIAFLGREYQDLNWGKNYANPLGGEHKLAQEELMAIKSRMAQVIEQISGM